MPLAREQIMRGDSDLDANIAAPPVGPFAVDGVKVDPPPIAQWDLDRLERLQHALDRLGGVR
jgi:hypothetical protein